MNSRSDEASLEALGADREIITLILKKQKVEVCTVFAWL
jgi:hypothetical protein